MASTLGRQMASCRCLQSLMSQARNASHITPVPQNSSIPAPTTAACLRTNSSITSTKLHDCRPYRDTM